MISDDAPQMGKTGVGPFPNILTALRNLDFSGLLSIERQFFKFLMRNRIITFSE